MKLKAVVISVLFIVFICQIGYAQTSKTNSSHHSSHKEYNFNVGEYVKVMMPNGREVVAIVKGKMTDNKYYVRKYKSDMQGKVNKKFIRAMTKEEKSAFKSRHSDSSST